MLPCAQPVEPLVPPKEDPLPFTDIHAELFLQYPQPIVLVHCPQSVIAEQTGAGHDDESIVSVSGGNTVVEPLPLPGEPFAVAAAMAALLKHLFKTVDHPQAKAPAQSLQFV
jgi:hypothetical protein